MKRILKLSEPLSFEALDLRGIETHRDRLHELYKNVYGRAAFRLGCLQPEDMACLKREMGERFQVWIAKLDGEIIGFHCGMTDGREVEAFFVGFEGRHNKSHALYQRMLVEFIQWGLALGCTSVNLGRTALDIKASLGAEPQRLVLHERMDIPIMHALSIWAAGNRPEAACPQAPGSRNQSIMKSSPPPPLSRFLSLGDHVLPASQTCIAGSGRGYATRAASTRPAQRSRFPWCRTTDGC